MNHPTPTLPPVVTCRAVTAIALLVAVLLAVPTSAQTRVRSTDRTTAGLVVAAVGTGLMVVAYDWRGDCDDGYRSRYEDNYSGFDYCTTFSERESFTQPTPLPLCQ